MSINPTVSNDTLRWSASRVQAMSYDLGTANPQPVDSTSMSFSTNDFYSDAEFGGNDEIQQQIWTMMNYFQKYRVTSIDLWYRPYYTNQTTTNFITAGTQTNPYFVSLQDDITNPSYNRSSAQLASSSLFVTIVPTKDDLYTRNSVSEYRRVCLHPAAKTFERRQEFKTTLSPYLADALMTGPANSAIVPAGSAQTTAMMYQPMECPFIPTKITNPSAVGFNDVLQLYGMKLYMYSPLLLSGMHDNIIAAISIPCGELLWTYNFEFRDIDYRPLVVLPSLTSTSELIRRCKATNIFDNKPRITERNRFFQGESSVLPDKTEVIEPKRKVEDSTDSSAKGGKLGVTNEPLVRRKV